MNLLLAVLLAFAGLASAAPEPKPFVEVGGELCAVDDAGSQFALCGDAVTIWDAANGKPTARIQLPRQEHKFANGTTNGSPIYQAAFSHDGGSLAIARSFLERENPKDEHKVPEFVTHHELFLADIHGEKIVRRLYQSTDSCMEMVAATNPKKHYPIFCGGLDHFDLGRSHALYGMFDALSFARDDGRVAFALGRTAGKAGHIERSLIVTDLSGKVVEDRVLAELDNPIDESEPRSAFDFGGDVYDFAPSQGLDTILGSYDPQGRLIGVAADDSSCQSVDLLQKKRIAFLEGCTRATMPEVLRDGLYGAHFDQTTKTLQVWSLADGTSVLRKAFAPEGDRFQAFALSADKRYFIVREKVEGANDFAFALYAPENGRRQALVPEGPLGAVAALDAAGTSRFIARVVIDPAKSAYDTSNRLYSFDAASAPAMPAAAAAAAPSLDVDSPPETKAPLDPNAYAVVIGVEKYRQEGIPSVDFAAHDAQTMYSYLTGAMGFDPKNVVLLTNASATRTDLQKNLKWLSNRATATSRVFVYYAGHGSPNPETGEGYLMPYEADPAYLDETAFPIAKLYASLGRLPTKDVTVVLDACFSGQGGRSLIAKGTRPLVSVVQSKAEPNTVVLAAAGSNQVSASYPEARHGLLTYYLLAGLHGEADAKHDGKITADELISYVRPAVERAAKLQNVEQTPSLMSPPDASSRPWIVLAPKK